MSRRVFVLRQAMSPAEQPHTARSGRCAAPQRDPRARRATTPFADGPAPPHGDARRRSGVTRDAVVSGGSSRATLPCVARRGRVVTRDAALRGASRVGVTRDAAVPGASRVSRHARRCPAWRVAGESSRARAVPGASRVEPPLRDAALRGASRVSRHPRRCPAWRVAGESSRATLPCMASRVIVTRDAVRGASRSRRGRVAGESSRATQPCMARRG